MDEVPRAFSISDIQSSPAGVECMSVASEAAGLWEVKLGPC